LYRREKEAIVATMQEKFKDTPMAVLTKFTGLNVQQMTTLRRELRDVGAEYMVVKNTLLRLAAKDTGMALLSDHFRGPIAIALWGGDPVAVVKVMTEFSQEYPAFEIRAGLLEGHVLTPEQVKRLASLPSREVLIAQLLSMLQALPTRLVRALNAPLQKLVWTVNAIKETKGQS